MNEHGNSPWRIGWESAKANRLPATVLWAVAAAMVLAYYNAPWFTSALEPLRRFQVNYGVVAAVVNQMFFCGLVPCAFMLTVKEIRTAGARGRQAVLLGGERRVCVAAEPHGRVQGPSPRRGWMWSGCRASPAKRPTGSCSRSRRTNGRFWQRRPDKSCYSGFSLWDTFRAAHPLYTILVPEQVPAFVESMLSHYRAVGYLPVIPYFGRESFCMIGNHAVPVVVDAALKGFGGFDLDEAFRAIDDSLSCTHAGKPKEDWGLYDSLGYYPFDRVKAESVSRTLECGTDDACAARLARRLGKADRAAFYERRAAYYRNLYDEKTGFFRARDSQGRWIEPFDPFQVGHEGNRPNPYTEGNAWQYRFHVLHDVPGMVALMGGKDSFAAKLNALFEEKGDAVGTDVVRDVSGLVGQYAQGNEQSHHVAYLYMCAGRPDKAAARIGEIFATQYRPHRAPLCARPLSTDVRWTTSRSVTPISWRAANSC